MVPSSSQGVLQLVWAFLRNLRALVPCHDVVRDSPGITTMGACLPTPSAATAPTHSFTNGGKGKRVAITPISGLCGKERGVSLRLIVTMCQRV